MKLRFKILIGFIIVIVVFLIAIAYNLVFLNRTSRSIQVLVEKKFTTEKYIKESNVIVMQIHSDIWDAMLFDVEGRKNKIENLHEQARDFYSNIRILKENISEKEESLEKLNSIFRSYYQFGSVILKMGSLDEFKNRIDTVDKFKDNKLKLIDILDETVSSSSKDFEAALISLNKSFQFATVITAVFTGLTIIIAIIISFIIASTLTKPIRSLMNVITEVEKDNLDVEANVKTSDEIGKLSKSFNNMIKQVKLSREKLKESERLKREMEIAERIQTSLVPLPPEHDDLDIAASMCPAEEVGGDYYDIVFDRDNKLWLAIGDVSGHGVTPGLVMMMAETSFNTSVSSTHNTIETTPKDAMITVNKMLTENIRNRLKEKHFMTMSFLKYDGEGEFTHAGAHLDILVYRSKTKTCDVYETKGLYLGIKPDISDVISNAKFNLEIGDVLVIYTDGVIESRHKDDYSLLFGMDKLKEVIVRNGHKDSQSIMKAISKAALDWCDYKPSDDISMIVAKRKR